MNDYTLLDLTLRRTRSQDGMEFAASIRNVFDEAGYEPSLSPGQIPNDLPLPGRSFYLEASYLM